VCDAEVPSTYAVKTKCRNEAAVILGFHHVKFDSVLLVQFFIIRARMYYLHVYYMCWYESGRSSSCDLSLGFERQLFAVDIFWQLLCSSAKLHGSLLQVAVWVSV